MRQPYLQSRYDLVHQRGIAMIVTLVLITILGILGAVAVMTTTTDLSIGATYQASQTALFSADAGLNYTLAQLSGLIGDGTLALDGRQATEAYSFKAPHGLTFQLDDQGTFTRISDTRKYVFRVIGQPYPKSPVLRTIEAVVQRRSALPYGVFGDDQVNLPGTGAIFSYDTNRTPSPDPIGATGEVKIGANGVVTAQASHLPLDVDGSIMLGAQHDGTDALFTFRDPSPDIDPPPTSVAVGGGHELDLIDARRMDSDPLDVRTLVEKANSQFSVTNQNPTVAAITGGVLTNSAIFTAGQYHLKTIALSSGMSLTLDARDGDIDIFTQSLSLVDNMAVTAYTDGRGRVTIYLEGPGHVGTASGTQQPTVHQTGPPTHFQIFSTSKEPLTFHHHGDFSGMIYAPYAPITVNNSSATGYGLLWGKSVVFNDGLEAYTFYVDTAIQSRFLATSMELLSWKEVWN